jgi:hypothetical protein
MNLEKISRNISNVIPPNYSTWETIELTYLFCMDAVIRGVPGDFVECGVAAGNNFGAMLKAGRFGWGFDSFEGIPWKGPNDDQQPGFNELPSVMEGKSSGVSSHTVENVVKDLTKWGIDPSQYKLVKGWFEDTIPVNEVKQISVLRLDGDLYESTLIPLVHLYPRLSVGGILIIDDWNLVGCQKAFHDYFKDIPVSETDITTVYENGNPRYIQKTR